MRTSCLIDLRCLQDPPYRERGIGRHARTLLAQARANLPAVRLIGITDAEMPALPEAERAMVDGIRTTSYTGALAAPCCFVQLSPMTHDPLFVARLLHHPAIPAATVVYDFIPHDNPQRYLPSPDLRLSYAVSLRWLARHQLFLPISVDSGDALGRLLGVPSERMVVTGATLAPAFETLATGRPRHVLVVGGDDARKNAECAVRAHASNRALQDAQVPVVITGEYTAGWIDGQRAAIAGLGGNPLLLRTPGHVDETTLLRLYADAICVVVPSLAEGFSLPVIEAMAASVPALASDIPAHRELLQEGLFDPHDHHALAGLLDLVLQPAWREACRKRQALVWPRFTSRAVGRRFWSSVDRLAPQTAPSVPASRAVIALMTPVPPDPSDIARYSAATCVELGQHVELHVFTDTPDAECPVGAASISPLSAYPGLASRFDRVMGVLGGNKDSIGILRLLIRHGGAAILLDGRMAELHACQWGLEQTARQAGHELGRDLRDGELAAWLSGDGPCDAMMLAEVAAAAEPLILHSASVIEARRRFERWIEHLPMPIRPVRGASGPTETDRRLARQRLGIGRDTVLIISLGVVTAAKAPFDCLWALILLRSWGVDAQLHFVGAPRMDTDGLRALVARHRLEPVVSLASGPVDDRTCRTYLMAADLGLQLDGAGFATLSGSLADCIGAHLRCVVSESLARSLEAEGLVETVPDRPSPVLIAEAAMRLLNRPETLQSPEPYLAARSFALHAARLRTVLQLG